MEAIDLLQWVPAALLAVGAGAAIISAKNKKPKFKQPVPGRVSSPFGYRIHPITQKSEFHNGIDIACPQGTPVVCPFQGRVLSVNRRPPGGLQVIIKHDNGYSTGYAHLQSTDLYPGRAVKAGGTVGLSGNSGLSTGPHLHFTLTNKDGVKVNPAEYLT